jgi:hypothetical protein
MRARKSPGGLCRPGAAYGSCDARRYVRVALRRGVLNRVALKSYGVQVVMRAGAASESCSVSVRCVPGHTTGSNPARLGRRGIRAPCRHTQDASNFVSRAVSESELDIDLNLRDLSHFDVPLHDSDEGLESGGLTAPSGTLRGMLLHMT